MQRVDQQIEILRTAWLEKQQPHILRIQDFAVVAWFLKVSYQSPNTVPTCLALISQGWSSGTGFSI